MKQIFTLRECQKECHLHFLSSTEQELNKVMQKKKIRKAKFYCREIRKYI